MKILAIETSCDETAISIVSAEGGLESPAFSVLSQVVSSQTEIHAPWGGVVPSLAKRAHSENIVPILFEALEMAGLSAPADNPVAVSDSILEILHRETEAQTDFADRLPTIAIPDIDMIVVTKGPGLEPALWVGINFARALSLYWDKPLVPTNHMLGHAVSALLSGETVEFPALALLVSGGHTEILSLDSWTDITLIGETLDDAAGEALDKGARLLGLGYPGGREITRLSDEARAENLPRRFELPRPMLHSGDYNFSFSGLKTALLYTVKKIDNPTDEDKKIIAREFEEAVIEVLVKKTFSAVIETGARTILTGGGVLANHNLRQALQTEADKNNLKIIFPPTDVSTDNATMIAMAGYLDFLKNKNGADLSGDTIRAEGNLGFLLADGINRPYQGPSQ